MARPRSRQTATEAQLRAWVDAGESAHGIAQRLGRSPCCVSHALQLLGIGYPHPGKPELPSERIAEYVRAVEAGESLVAIGQRYGVTKQAVQMALLRRGHFVRDLRSPRGAAAPLRPSAAFQGAVDGLPVSG